jgi:TolB protein
VPRGAARRRVLSDAKDPAFTASGRRVVYAHGDPLFRAFPDGSHVRQLTTPDYSDFLPSYSRSGHLIAFQRGYDYGEDEGFSWIYVMRADGTHARRLTPERAISWSPRIAPDDEQVVWSSEVRVGGHYEYDLISAGVDGSHRHRLTTTDHADERDPEFSPHGRQIVFARVTGADTTHENSDIYVMNRDGTHVRRLTRTDDVYEEQPQFSPDGRRILFETSPHDQGSFHNRDIAVMKRDGSERRRLTSSADDEYRAHYAPDGRRVAYTRYDGNQADVYVVPASGGTRTRVTVTGRSERAVAWLPATAAESR